MALNIYPTINSKETVPIEKEKKIYPEITEPEPVETPVTSPSNQPASVSLAQPVQSSVIGNLDPSVVLLAKSIRQHESGNKAQLPGEGASVGGASLYQYTHGTWKSVAQKYLGDANAPLTRENENKATYLRILDWKKKGFTPGQIASMWNAGEGEPNAYLGKFSNGNPAVGTNKWGVKYNVPSYAQKVYNTYKKLKGEEAVELPKSGEYGYSENLKKFYENNIQDEDTKKLIQENKIKIDENGKVELSDEYRKELIDNYNTIKDKKNELLVKISGLKTATKDDLKVINNAYDTGDTMRLNAAIERIVQSSKASENEKVDFISWANNFNAAIDKVFEAPILKQAKQLTGITVGSANAYINSIINLVGSNVVNAVSLAKGEGIKINPIEQVKKAAKEGYEVGKQIGEEGAKGSIYAVGGVIPNALLSVPQSISGGAKIGEGLEEKDKSKLVEGGVEAGLGLVGGLPFYSGKLKSNLLIDRNFFGATSKEVDALKGLALDVDRAKVVNNIFDKKIVSEIDTKFDSAIKPSFTGRKTVEMAKKYNDDKHNAVMSIVDNKSNLKYLDESGNEIVGKSPETVEQFSQAIDQTLSKVFKEYDSLKTATGKAGVQVNTQPIAENMLKIIDDPKFKAWEDLSPGTVDYLINLASRLEKRVGYTPAETQALIEELNANLKAFYRNPNPSEVTKTAVNASLAGELRKALDETITKTTGEGYQALRNKYKQLKTIQNDVNRAMNRVANAPERGLVDNLTNPFAGAEILSGIISGNPSQIARGFGIQAIRNWYKKITNPDFRIKKMFENIDNLIKQREDRLSGKTLVETAKNVPIGLSIEDVSKKLTPEQIKSNIAARQVVDKSKPTTKILNELNGKTSVKRQYIEDLLRKPDITKVEKQIIEEALKTEGDVINTKLFVEKVQNELLPLKRMTSLGNAVKYESVTLPDELRGNVFKYTEHVYNSPIRTSAGSIHFGEKGTENYFGHTRIEDMADSSLDKAMRKPDSTRRVIEVQSDLMQKNRLESEFKLPEDVFNKVKSQFKDIKPGDIENYIRNCIKF